MKSADSQFNQGDVIIATSSQDKYIRIWRVSDVTESLNTDDPFDSNGEIVKALRDAEM